MSVVTSKPLTKVKAEEEPFEIAEVKYELNTVENMKKAKENVTRSDKTTMIITHFHIF